MSFLHASTMGFGRRGLYWRENMNKIAKGAVVLFFLLCVVWYWHETVTTVVPVIKNASDFSAYYEAARNVVAGHSPFATWATFTLRCWRTC